MDKVEITGGATLWARQTIESEIFYNKPAEWFKIWFYLVNRASYKDTKRFKRGEAFLQYEWICDATGASQNQVKKCLMWLRNSSMIRTRRSTRGTNIQILNYSHYQRLDNYYYDIKEPQKELEKNQRRTREEPRYNKKEKKEKNIYIPTQEEVIKYFEEKGYQKSIAIKAFDYYDANDWKDANGKKVKSWKQKMIGVWFKPENKIGRKDYSKMKQHDIICAQIKIQNARKRGEPVDEEEAEAIREAYYNSIN